MGFPWGSVIGGAASIFGNIFSSKKKEETYDKMLEAYYNEFYEAQRRNQAAYNKVLQEYLKLENRLMNQYGQLTGQGAADIRTGYKAAAAGGYQDLVSRGLAGTTIWPTLQQGYTRGEMEALNRWKDAVLGRKMSLQERLALARLGMMERVSYPYPTQQPPMYYGGGGTDWGKVGTEVGNIITDIVDWFRNRNKSSSK